MDEHLYATTVDLDYTNSRIEAIEVMARTSDVVIRDQIGDLMIQVDDIRSNLEFGCATADIFELKQEVDGIKSVLIDIQDMLRRLGLDDVESKSGDLNLLLT